MSIQDLAQKMLSELAFANTGDLTSFNPTSECLDAILAMDLSDAEKKRWERIQGILNQTILGDIKYEEGLQMIEQGVTSAANLPSEGSSEEAPESAPQDNKQAELLAEFLSGLPTALESMESHILALEKGEANALDQLKSTLHTLKGEFGVVELPILASLIHNVESLLDEHASNGVWLMAIKDFLATKVASGDPQSVLALDESHIEDLLDPELHQTNAEIEQLETKASQETPPPPPEESMSFISEFITESQEHFEELDSNLLTLETEPENQESLDAVFRACHSIKGVSAFLDLVLIKELAHNLENLMVKAKRHEMVLTAEMVHILITGFGALRECVEHLAAAPHEANVFKPGAYDHVITQLEDVANGKAPSASVPKPAAAAPSTPDGSANASSATSNTSTPAAPSAAPAPATGAKIAVEDTIRISTRKLDELIDAVGEAVIAQAMISDDTTVTDLESDIQKKDRLMLRNKIQRNHAILSQIQELSMSLRMVSLKATFQKATRLIRDLSRKLDKPVDLTQTGEGTELDKTIVELLADPLGHMIRNAMDHGLETPNERVAAGKSETGHVQLKAFHRAGSIVIEIQDDGRGIDQEKILAKAVKNGIVGPEDILSESEIYQLLFHAGFSTAAKVTEVSGRGVGMDVVKKNIEAMRGSIHVSSVLGEGTTFSIILPLTLAIINGMYVGVGKETYIIPTLTILESLKPEEHHIERVRHQASVFNLRGETMPLYRLSDLYSLPCKPMEFEEGIVMVIQGLTGNKTAIFVDKLLGQQQVVIKQVDDNMGKLPGITGAAIKSDGNAAMILDINEMLSVYAQLQKDKAASA